MKFWILFLLLSAVIAYDSNYMLDLSNRYVTFSGVAYCTDQKLRRNTVNDWSCKACKTYPHVTAISFHGYINDANGYVGYDSEANEIIIAFSGTNPLSIQNWIDDLDFFQTPYPYCAACAVHRGFYDTYLSVDSQMKDLVKNFTSQYPSASLAITGHSLGAAMAAHCAAELIHSGFSIKTVYSYGMPRVGNEAFEKWYSSIVPGTFRLIHHKDPVPHLAPSNWNFHHMPYEIFYTKDYKDWKLCNFEGEDVTCADQYAVDLNVGK
jgi:predicted lipase